MNKQDGFTLVELLVVLMITLSLAFFILPKLSDTLRSQEQRNFFQLFASDNLLVQSYNLYSDHQGKILLYPKRYYVDLEEYGYHRSLPEPLSLDNPSYRIVYSTTGSVLQPYTYRYRAEGKLYRVIFPFGKGRFYVEE